MSDVKKQAIIFKQRAQELGYEIKLTHCQEILAKIHGHETRHSFLLTKDAGVVSTSLGAENLDKKNKLLQEIKAILERASVLITEDQSKIYTLELAPRYQELGNLIAAEELASTALDVFKEFEKFKLFSVGGQDENPAFNSQHYLDLLNSQKLVGKLFYGLAKKNGEVIPVIINPLLDPHAMFVGSMGSGKSMGNHITIFTFLKTNPEAQVHIVDTERGALDYQHLKAFKNCSVILEETGARNLITSLYDELSARVEQLQQAEVGDLVEYAEKTGKSMPWILTAFEWFGQFDTKVLNFSQESKQENSLAYKFKQILRLGRKVGLVVHLCAQRAKEVPAEIVANMTNKLVFWCPTADCQYLLGHEKSNGLRLTNRGRAYTDFGMIAYPDFGVPAQIELINKANRS